MITNIQPFSLHDGPGIRTTVFLKGCNLHCYWCHNPEAIGLPRQVQFFASKCIGCGACAKICPKAEHGKTALENGNCTACGACVEGCYAEARVMAGKEKSAQELTEELMKDQAIFEKSGGGVTFSGGEPFLQSEYLMECLLLLHQAGIHTAVETAACVEWSRIERALPFLDLFICDLKSMDEEALYEATGGNLPLILENIRKVSETQIPFRVRTPVIPGFNDTTENMEKMAEFMISLPRKPFVELLPFHNLSVGKYASLGQTYAAADIKPPEKEQMRRLNEILKAHQIEVKEI